MSQQEKDESYKIITEFERELEVENYNKFNPDFDMNEDEFN